MLHALLGEAFDRRVACFGSRDRTLRLRRGTRVIQHRLSSLAQLQHAPSVVLHLAFLTQRPNLDISAADYVVANRAIRRLVISELTNVGAEEVFLASSGAAYLADSAGALLSKGLYGSLKLEDEACFDQWRRQTGKTAVIARVFNLSGPYINRRSSYALACFIADALADRPIEILARGPVFRSYVAIEELMNIVFGALLGPQDRTIRFDTAGDKAHELEELAETVALALDHHRGMRRPTPLVSDLTDRYVGDRTAYAAMRAEFGQPSITLVDQIRQTAQFMAECPGES